MYIIPVRFALIVVLISQLAKMANLNGMTEVRLAHEFATS